MKRILTILFLLAGFTAFGQTYKTTTSVLNDSTTLFRSGTYTANLDNRYARLSDGVVTGLTPTTNGDSLLIASGTYRLNGLIKTATSYVFGDIPPSSVGLSRVLVVYGLNTGALDTLSGAESNNPVAPTFGADTVILVQVLVSDAGLGVPSVDLSNYVTQSQLNEENLQKVASRGNAFLDPNRNPGMGTISLQIGKSLSTGNTLSLGWNPNDGGYGLIGTFSSGKPLVLQRRSYTSPINPVMIGYNEGDINPDGASMLMVRGDINLNSGIYRIEGVPYSVASSVNSGFLTNTDWSIFNSKQDSLTEINFGNFMDIGLATKLTPSSGDFLLGRDVLTNEAVEIPFSTVEVPLTFSSPLVRSVNTISIPAATTSVSGHLTSTDWNTFNNKQNTISFGTIGSTPNANGASIASSVITLQPASATFGGLVTTGTQTFGGAKTFSTVQATNFGAGIAPNANFGFTGAASTTTTAPFLITPGVAYTGTQNGALHYVSADSTLRMYRFNNSDQVLFNNNNKALKGGGTGSLVADNDGNISKVPIADRLTANDLSKSANYTVLTSDFGANGMLTVYVNTSGGDVTITLPSPTNMRNLEITVIKTTAGNNVIISGSANINGSASITESAQYKSYTLVSNGTQYYIKGERP